LNLGSHTSHQIIVPLMTLNNIRLLGCVEIIQVVTGKHCMPSHANQRVKYLRTKDTLPVVKVLGRWKISEQKLQEWMIKKGLL